MPAHKRPMRRATEDSQSLFTFETTMTDISLFICRLVKSTVDRAWGMRNKKVPSQRLQQQAMQVALQHSLRRCKMSPLQLHLA